MEDDDAQCERCWEYTERLSADGYCADCVETLFGDDAQESRDLEVDSRETVGGPRWI